MYFSIYLFFTLFCIIKVSSVSLKDYCKFDSYNTPCYTECIRSKSCGQTEDGFQTLTDAERERALNKHNELRQAAASGENESNNIPASDGGLYVFSYDKEVEFLAACHIKACSFKHDTVRLSADGQKMGQNLYMFMFGRAVGFNGSFIEDGIQSWYNEYHNLQNSNCFKDYSPTSSGSKYGHLTAILWGTTKYLGCAKMHTYQNKLHNYMLFCNYMPGGNIIGAPIYKDGTCTPSNAIYPKLCGEIRSLADDDFVSPVQLDKGDPLMGLGMMVYLVLYFIVEIL